MMSYQDIVYIWVNLRNRKGVVATVLYFDEKSQ